MKIGEGNPEDRICLVAEVGINHEGSLDRAKELAYEAALSGADAVKLQTCLPEMFAPFGDRKRLKMLQDFHLSFTETENLFSWAADNRIHIFSTPLDLESAEFLASLGTLVKVSSGDITFAPLLEKLKELEVDIILSTGGSTTEEIFQALEWCSHGPQTGRSGNEVALMHCVSLYPAPVSTLNLRAISHMREAFPGRIIGFSDHSLGLDAPVIAASMGARIIEKHFTLDKQTSGFRDHQLALEPAELASLRTRLDTVEESLGSPKKAPGDIEQRAIGGIRRSIFFGRRVPKGSIVSIDDLAFRRPGDGMSPAAAKELVGRQLVVDAEFGTQAEPQMFGDV